MNRVFKRCFLFFISLCVTFFSVSAMITPVNAAQTTTAYTGIQTTGGTLINGQKYFVAVTNINTSVFFTLPAYGEITVTGNASINGIGYAISVNTPGPGFDNCPNGELVNYDPTDNSWKYYCSGGGVQDLKVYLYSELDITGNSVSEDDFSIVLREDMPSGTLPTKSDFTVFLDINGVKYPMAPSQWELSNVTALTDLTGTVKINIGDLTVTDSWQITDRTFSSPNTGDISLFLVSGLALVSIFGLIVVFKRYKEL